jgi:pimeloyl-ACP methyl ester carboxylesterase
VYEFGPENGRKVLLLHGISTPCIALSQLGHGLASKSCRVLLLDLFGRGYSDSVDLPHDARLYTTQILLAIASSPLAWTPGGFSIIGYSFGGGIAADFAGSFPEMVKGIVLLAPGGLIRQHHFNRQSRIMFSGWVPVNLLEWLIRRRLGGDRTQSAVRETGNNLKSTTEAEIRGNRDPIFEDTVLSSERPDVTIGCVVEWQLRNHDGFVKSFISSMRYGSIEGKQQMWKRLGMRDDKVMIIAGSEDTVIDAVELREDALNAIGEDNVAWRVVDCGHEFPVKKANEVLDLVSQFWNLG